MILNNMPRFFSEFLDFLNQPQWKAWPFDSGYGETMLPAVARLVFVILIFGVILLFLRVLFGPGGFFRDHELEREAEEETQQEKAELRRMLDCGEITEFEYEIRSKGLD